MLREAVAEPTPVEPTAAAPTSIPGYDTVPPFPAVPALDAAGQRRARNLNTQALAAHKREAWPEAIALYIEALNADPSFVLARYNLACAYARANEREAALVVLEQLRAGSCEACRRQLAFAARDKDLEALWSDARFRAAVNGEAAADADAGSVAAVEPADDDGAAEAAPEEAGAGADGPAEDAPTEAVAAEAPPEPEEAGPQDFNSFELGADQEFGVLEAALATELGADKRPVDPRRRFALVDSPIIFWINVRNATDEAVPLEVVWKKGDVEKSRATLDIGVNKNGWRTRAMRPLGKRDAGPWSVEVVDESGAVLHTFPFEVEADEAP